MKRIARMCLFGLMAASMLACNDDEKKSGNGGEKQQYASIQGKVTDKATGLPLAEVTISVQPSGIQVQTSQDGEYSLDSLKVDTYTLTAQKEGYYDFKREDIALMPDQIMPLDIELEEQQAAMIQGKVTDKETGEPLAEVTVTLLPIETQVVTTQDGTYVFDSLRMGSYTLTAQKEGYLVFTSESIELGADQAMSLDITLENEYKADADYTVTTFGLNMEMVFVEGGEFEMGATAEQEEDAASREKPVRTIKLNSYHIGKYEVTQAQWRAVMESNISRFTGDDHPVEQVSWVQAQAFCDSLSKKTGLKYVLPTEAQWEYAARGGKKSTGYKYAGSNEVEEVAWFEENSKNLGEDNPDYGTHAVGLKKANELGIFDMSGNVIEWCSDFYGKYDETETDNPQGPASGNAHVTRGGGWTSAKGNCRVSFRLNGLPTYSYFNLGFRVAVVK